MRRGRPSETTPDPTGSKESPVVRLIRESANPFLDQWIKRAASRILERQALLVVGALCSTLFHGEFPLQAVIANPLKLTAFEPAAIPLAAGFFFLRHSSWSSLSSASPCGIRSPLSIALSRLLIVTVDWLPSES